MKALSRPSLSARSPILTFFIPSMKSI